MKVPANKLKGTKPAELAEQIGPSDPPTRADRFTWYPGDVVVVEEAEEK